jgi:hypothetical protein
VEQAVVATCGSRRKVETLYEKHFEAAQRTVARCAGTCGAATYDDDVIMLRRLLAFHLFGFYSFPVGS